MDKLKYKRTKQVTDNRKSLAGSYSVFMTVIVLAIIITVNFALSLLPDSYTQEDLTANQLYSISSQSKVLLSSLDEDVSIYWVVTGGKEDEYVERLLDNYADYSSHIKVEKKDPDLNPDFTNSYTDGTVYNNSVIVECGDKFRYISYDEMYGSSSAMLYSAYASPDEFSAEKLITSAISYCTTDELPVVHLLEGHGEKELTDSFRDALETDNIETEALSLLNSESVPDNVKAIIINAPETDISETERDMLIDYLDNGGRVLIMSGTAAGDELDNLNAVAENYGLKIKEGIVVEQSPEHYVFTSPILLMPDINESSITDPLIEDSYRVILPVAKALDISDVSDDIDAVSLLESSDESFLKPEGYDIDSYEKDEADETGPFTLAAMLTKDIDEENSMQLIWVASSLILEDLYNQYSSDANEDIVLNAIELMCEKDDSISVRSKSLANEYLTVNSKDASMIKAVTIGIIPAAILLIGIFVVIRRRKK